MQRIRFRLGQTRVSVYQTDKELRDMSADVPRFFSFADRNYVPLWGDEPHTAGSITNVVGDALITEALFNGGKLSAKIGA